MKNFDEFVNEKYEFKFVGNEYSIHYEFTNKDDLKFMVYFNMCSEKQKIYVMDYGVYIDDVWERFIELNTYDAINITKTVVKIILEFINRFNPNQIIIEHIPTEKEKERYGNMLHDIWREKSNKRALLSKMYIEDSLPEDYQYTLRGSTSYITKFDFVRKGV